MKNIIDYECSYFAFMVRKSNQYFFSDPTSGKLYVVRRSGKTRQIVFNLG